MPPSTVSAPVYVTLLHHPIRNRNGELITTAVTNMDIHDISRSARTYGIRRFFLVTPLEVQHGLVRRILSHWRSDASQVYHPDRVEAVQIAELAHDFAEVKARVREAHGEEPEVVLTDARPFPNSVGYADYRKELEAPGRTRPVILVFGTGWGVAETFYPEVHRILAPVCGPAGWGEANYNHLSVRAAAAIIMDRLFGT